MSIDENIVRNTMIQTPPAKKGYHFASDGIHFAEFIEAASIEEATAIYHKVKRPFSTATPVTTEPIAAAEEQSTPLPEESEQE